MLPPVAAETPQVVRRDLCTACTVTARCSSPAARRTVRFKWTMTVHITESVLVVGCVADKPDLAHTLLLLSLPVQLCVGAFFVAINAAKLAENCLVTWLVSMQPCWALTTCTHLAACCPEPTHSLAVLWAGEPFLPHTAI